MIRKLRKYNKWFMVAFGVLLMLTWLAGPSTKAISQMGGNHVVAKIDGKSVRIEDEQLAAQELHALAEFAPMLTRGLGLEDHDRAHWMLLCSEARAGGFIGEASDGKDFIDTIATETVRAELQQNPQALMDLFRGPNPPKSVDEAIKGFAAGYSTRAPGIFHQNRLNELEMNAAFAKARGIVRMASSLRQAPRVSDRESIAEARKYDDTAVVDYAFLPASAISDQVPDPDETSLQAQFDRFKGTRPGEGDYGIGYLLPARVKIEWLQLDRKAIEDAVTLDPVEVLKRYKQGHADKYKGELTAERANVEHDMKAETASRVLGEAHLVVQAEVSKATRRLERAGKYRVLPPDWETQRPQLKAVAQAVVDQVSHNLGTTVPLPAVTIKGEWLTQSDLNSLPGIGASALNQGGQEIPFSTVAFWTHELGGHEGPIPVQQGVPLSEVFLTDGVGNRYYFTVLGTRGESAPDSAQEIREKAVADYKKVQAFEKLKGRIEEFRQAAVTGGIDGAVAAFAATPVASGKTIEKPVVHQASKVHRLTAEGRELQDESLEMAIMDAASKLDPKSAPDSAPPDQTSLVLPASKQLGLAVVRIRAFVPMTREEYARIDRAAANQVTSEEEKAAAGTQGPFSLDALLKRHVYMNGDKRAETSADLHLHDKDDSSG